MRDKSLDSPLVVLFCLSRNTPTLGPLRWPLFSFRKEIPLSDKLPPLSVDLIDELDRLYPALSPSEIYRLDREKQLVRAAQRELVDALVNRKNELIEDS